jgi:hypothetical protein
VHTTRWTGGHDWSGAGTCEIFGNVDISEKGAIMEKRDVVVKEEENAQTKEMEKSMLPSRERTIWSFGW